MSFDRPFSLMGAMAAIAAILAYVSPSKGHAGPPSQTDVTAGGPSAGVSRKPPSAHREIGPADEAAPRRAARVPQLPKQRAAGRPARVGSDSRARDRREAPGRTSANASRSNVLRLTLRKALAMARKQNLQLLAKRFAVGAARERVRASYGAFGPHISASASLQFIGGKNAFEGDNSSSSSSPFGCDDPTDMACAQQMAETMCGTSDPSDSCVQFLMTSDGQNTARILGNTLSGMLGGFGSIGKIFKANTFKPAITAVWPLFNAQAWLGMKMTKLGVRMASLQVSSTVQDVMLNVHLVFYQVLQLQELEALAQESMKSTKIHMKQTEALIAAGTATRTDLLRWEAQLEQNRLDWLKARLGVSQLKMLLNNLLGRPLRASLVPPKEVTSCRLPAAGSLSERDLLTSHPQIKLMDASLQAKRLEIRSVQARFLPTLNLTAQYSWQRYIQYLDVVPKEWLGNWMVGLTLTVPIFDSMSDYYSLRSKRLEFQQVTMQRRNLRRMLLHQFHAARKDLDSALQQIRVARKQVDLAVEAHRTVEMLYQAGNAKTTDLLDAQMRQIQARANLIRTRYEYLIALARLKKAAGRMTGR